MQLEQVVQTNRYEYLETFLNKNGITRLLLWVRKLQKLGTRESSFQISMYFNASLNYNANKY